MFASCAPPNSVHQFIGGPAGPSPSIGASIETGRELLEVPSLPA